MEKSKAHNHENELSHAMVHYLLTIHKLKEKRGFARVTDIAKDLNLTKGSVSTALNNLKKKGLVTEEEDCKFLILTDKGHEEVHRILSSRTLLYYFLKDFVGVDEDIAERDACAMEHLMSSSTAVKFFEFMKKLSCICDSEGDKSHSQIEFSSSLNLCDFTDIESFVESQEGDKQLMPSEN